MSPWIPLAIDLLKNHNITVVGTLRKNEREILPSFLDNKKSQLNSTYYLRHAYPKKKIK